MSFEAMVWVLNHSPSRGADRLVMVAIASHVHADGRAYPSAEMLARETRMDRANVFRSVRHLRAAGELVVHSPGSGRGRSNTYKLSTGVVSGCHQYCCKGFHRDTEQTEPGCHSDTGVVSNRALNGVTVRPEPLRASKKRTNYRARAREATAAALVDTSAVGSLRVALPPGVANLARGAPIRRTVS